MSLGSLVHHVSRVALWEIFTFRCVLCHGAYSAMLWRCCTCKRTQLVVNGFVKNPSPRMNPLQTRSCMQLWSAMQINTSTLITKSTKDVQGPHLVVSSGPTPNTRTSTTESEPDRLRAVQVLYGDDGVPITASRSVNQTKWGFCKKNRGQYISTERLKNAKRIQRFQRYNPWREESPKLTIKFALKSVEPVNVQQVVEATQDLWKWSCRECHTCQLCQQTNESHTLQPDRWKALAGLWQSMAGAHQILEKKHVKNNYT